jgi:hypothetical protein
MPTYTDLSQVKRVLRSSSGEKVRFSDSIVGVNVGKLTSPTGNQITSNLDLEFNYTLVTIEADFEGDYVLKFLFTSPTEFKAIEVGEKIRRELALGTGDIATDYTTPNGLITVPSGCWGGTIITNSVVEIRFDSHMSDNSGNQYIEDAEVIIDATIEGVGVNYAIGAPRIFASGSVPDQVKVATTYLAAYMIFTDAFADFYKDKNEMKYSFVGGWKSRAEDLLMDYMKAVGRKPPGVISFPSFIDKFGEAEAGPGMSKWSTDYKTVTRDAKTEDIFNPRVRFRGW